MDRVSYTLKVKGAGREEADAILAALVEEGLAGSFGYCEYAFDRSYSVDPDGSVFFGSAGEVKDEPEEALGDLSRRYPRALFVLEVSGHDEDCGRTYFKGGMSHGAERVVRYEPFDEAKLA